MNKSRSLLISLFKPATLNAYLKLFVSLSDILGKCVKIIVGSYCQNEASLKLSSFMNELNAPLRVSFLVVKHFKIFITLKAFFSCLFKLHPFRINLFHYFLT